MRPPDGFAPLDLNYQMIDKAIFSAVMIPWTLLRSVSGSRLRIPRAPLGLSEDQESIFAFELGGKRT